MDQKIGDAHGEGVHCGLCLSLWCDSAAPGLPQCAVSSKLSPRASAATSISWLLRRRCLALQRNGSWKQQIVLKMHMAVQVALKGIKAEIPVCRQHLQSVLWFGTSRKKINETQLQAN